ncbi:putative bifunctional diguanylate cyclase/phosphodiesterase [Salinispirillum marinum]|uniref:Bifunctional diguanylate cyclase/phosphodiesterase n=2 Tax=Saccharospirillaceae TaxID=255527 RepID=A0ABV8BDJ6_9GAMM
MQNTIEIAVCLCIEHSVVTETLSRALSGAGFTVLGNIQDPGVIDDTTVVIFQPSTRSSHYLMQYGSRKAWIAYIDPSVQHQSLESYAAQGIREVLYADELAPHRLQRSVDRAIKQQHMLQRQSHYDGLTGLLSNRGFLEATDQALFNVGVNGRMVALLALDLRGFNDINQHYGFSFADQLLSFVSLRLKSTLGPLAKIARLGGDEFFVLLEQLSSIDAAQRVATRIRAVFDDPFRVHNESVRISADIGMVIYPETMGSAEELMRHAHAAMHTAKGRDISIYRYEQGAVDDWSENMEQALRLALRRGEFELFYQPKVCLRQRNILGMEALIRWRHPTQGLLSPQHFITAAESSGVIVPIGYWIIEQVCKDMQTLVDHGLFDVSIATNLSFRQLQDEPFCKALPRLLQEANVNLNCLEFELTETTMLTEPESALDTLNQVTALGVTISLDDFGTGYSSLAHIRQYPISTIKIDRSFTQRVSLDHEADSIVRSIINLAHDLNMQVVAEGVEDDTQLNFLLGNGCDQVQGYLFSEPRPMWEVLQLIDKILLPVNLSGVHTGQ